MPTDDDVIKQKIQEIFLFNLKDLALNESKEIAHYTSAEAGYAILKEQKFWFRNTKYMNDFSEGQWGWNLLVKAYNGTKDTQTKTLKAALDSIAPKLSEKFKEMMNNQRHNQDWHPYISCFCEHDFLENKEDDHGKLSMWRAYGRPHGVCLVFAKDVFLEGDETIDNLLTTKVRYWDQGEFKDQYYNILVNNINKHKDWDWIQHSVSSEDLLFILQKVLWFACHSIKHPGFKEEEEWRVVTWSEANEASDYMAKETVFRGGTPEIIYTLDLKKLSEKIPDVAIDKFIKRIIIGPSDKTQEQREAFIDILKQNNVSNPEERVVISGIPLR
jgi:hypothetical protein